MAFSSSNGYVKESNKQGLTLATHDDASSDTQGIPTSQKDNGDNGNDLPTPTLDNEDSPPETDSRNEKNGTSQSGAAKDTTDKSNKGKPVGNNN